MDNSGRSGGLLASVVQRARRRYRNAYMGVASPDLGSTTSGAGIRATYAVWSKFYDYSSRIDPAFHRDAAAMVEAVVRPGDRVLDVGTGTGLLLDTAAPRAASVVGLDYTASMLAKASARVAQHRWDNVALRWGDAHALVFADGAFDAGVSSFMLAHVPRPARAEVLRELARVTAPAGRLGLLLAQGELFRIWPTRGELESMLAGAGYWNVVIEDRDDVYRIVTAERPE